MKKKYINPEIRTYRISPSHLLVAVSGSILEEKVPTKPQSTFIDYLGGGDDGGSLSNTKTDSFD